MADPSIKDLAYRTAASVFGGPVDLATMVMRPFGYKTPDTQVVGGSEWIGKKMENAGLISSARAPLTEFIASVAVPTPGGIAKGAAMAAPAIGGMFIGKGARTWDALAAQKAKMMADMNIDARTIWKETGTWKGPDGKWRQEISDQSAKLTLGRGTPDEYGAIEAKTFEGALKHQQLKRAYPELNEITFLHYPKEEYLGANFDPRDMVVTMGQKAMNPKEGVALHELQHAIQQREGFASGGSPEQFKSLNDTFEMFSKLADKNLAAFHEAKKAGGIHPVSGFSAKLLKERADASAKEADNLLKQGASYDTNESYRRLAGEAEARATQARMNMTAEQRRATFPEESYDVPLNELIIRGASD
jgi:hypothetical protein